MSITTHDKGINMDIPDIPMSISLSSACTKKCKQFLLDDKHASIVVLQTTNGLVKKTKCQLTMKDKRTYKTEVQVIDGIDFQAVMSKDYISFKKSDSILFDSIDSFLATTIGVSAYVCDKTEVFVCSLFGSERVYDTSNPNLTVVD